MEKNELTSGRRAFLKKWSISALPLLLPMSSMNATELAQTNSKSSLSSKVPVNFIFDGLFMSPNEYVEKLQEISGANPIEPDFYGTGGVVKLLEDQFAKLTAKEKAIYLPTGTMANQLAIKLLSGTNTKVIVPENSHVYRDEADAAQSVHQKRLIPIGKDKPFFDLADLKEAINELKANEVFDSGLGVVVIENPIRRADGTTVPIKNISEIAVYCKEKGYRMHLDGARIHLASAYSGVSIKNYSAHFDTVYISLYKYLNAAGGAVLCGDAKIIDQVAHQIKILGGTVFQNWSNAAVALHYLEDIEDRWKKLTVNASNLIKSLNEIEGIKIDALANGTNIHHLKLSEGINLKTLANHLYNDHNIWLGRADDNGIVKFTINESLLTRDLGEVILAWKNGVK